jgi:hypothetical protein
MYGEVFITVFTVDDRNRYIPVDLVVIYHHETDYDFVPYGQTFIKRPCSETHIKTIIATIGLQPYSPTPEDMNDWNKEIEIAIEKNIDSRRSA